MLDDDRDVYYGDGAWYDAEYVHIRADVPYYVDVAMRAPGRFLELATGTGRIAIPMAKAGAHVVGVDVSPGMIGEAERKRLALPPELKGRLEFQVGDMRTLDLGRRFDGVVLAFNTLMHMTEDADLEGCLRTVRAHLEPHGRFYLDLHVPHPDSMRDRDPEGRFDHQQMIDPRTGERFVVAENNTYDPRSQINTMRFYYQRVTRDGATVGPELRRELKLRVIFPRELDRWLHLAGLAIEEDWDDFSRHRAFSARGGRRVLVVRPTSP